MVPSMPMPVRSRVAPEAFERALQLAWRGRDMTAVADALSTLHKIVSVDGHPRGTLDRIVEVARKRLATADSAMLWQVAVDLALATGDRRLRAMVARVAAGATEPSFSAGQHLGLWVRSAAQRALNRTAPVGRA